VATTKPRPVAAVSPWVKPVWGSLFSQKLGGLGSLGSVTGSATGSGGRPTPARNNAGCGQERGLSTPVYGKAKTVGVIHTSIIAKKREGDREKKKSPHPERLYNLNIIKLKVSIQDFILRVVLYTLGSSFTVINGL
jgi:hypothetical protein